MIKFILDGKPVKGLSIGYNIPENIKIGECIWYPDKEDFWREHPDLNLGIGIKLLRREHNMITPFSTGLITGIVTTYFFKTIK